MDTTNRSARLVSNWLLIGVGMTVVQIALGGITRLTGSGLSITEWDVLTGALPPLNHAQWLDAFDKYRQTPQFHLLNFDFRLSDFQFIFFWEWFHRLWARTIGLVFIVGFVWLLLKKHFQPGMIRPLIILFLLGALQGAIGWIMVASGLTGDATYVKPTRLALHFIFALGLLCYTFWFALRLRVPETDRMNKPRLHRQNLGLLLLLTLQLMYGALMAGHKAATMAPTWPTINGDWIPERMFAGPGFWVHFIENTILIHFIHRGLAYLLLVLTILWSVQLFKTPGTPLFRKWRRWPLLIICMQVLLGILTVLSSPGIIPGHWGIFEWMAQLHQLTGMLFLLSLVAMHYLSGSRKA